MKNIIVTGATGGLGKPIVEALANDENRVWAIGRSLEKLNSCFGGFQNVSIATCDYSQDEEMVDLVKSISLKNGGIDGFVHCAGGSKFEPLHMIKRRSLDEVFSVHVYSALIMCAAIAKKGIANQGCSIVLFSSLAAHEGASGNAVYASAKAAIEGFVRSSAHDFADKGVRINAIVPGDVDAGMFHDFLARLDSEQQEARQRKYPLGFGSEFDIARMVKFLVKPDSEWITGQCIVIDGGHSVCRI